ncbi:MAG: hypothetical protein PGN37_07270 [Mycobacterium kyogaense]|uniref:hypothetical protein n=1 Tax=Mycobacterium kyogaense TaxID=2212479 RepID=UPI002FFB67A1
MPARQLTVLTDAGESAWSSWNRFVTEFATRVGARITEIDDGGITGAAFHAHVGQARSAVLASPKRHTVATPPTLGVRPVAPIPLWTWSLLSRRDDDRPAVIHVRTALRGHADAQQWTAAPDDPWWAPADDPHLGALTHPG